MADIISVLEELAWRNVPRDVERLIKEASSSGKIVSELLLQIPSERPILKELKPMPLASILAGAAIGGTVGYGAGALGSSVLPDSWDKKRMRRNAALFGALAGTLPGAEWGVLNMIDGKPFNSTHFLKSSSVSSGLFPAFDPGEFNQVIWGDPRVAGRMQPAEKAVLSGFVTGAANIPSKRPSPFVTPADMGRVAVGMGSGYLSGALVGKTLGALMGMPESTQEKLKNVGLWAGVAKSVIPALFE